MEKNCECTNCRLQNAKNEPNYKLLNVLDHPWVDSALAVWRIGGFREIIWNKKYPLFTLSEKNEMYDGLLQRDVGLVLVYLLFPFKALFSHAEERDDSNKEEYKASLGFFKITI